MALAALEEFKPFLHLVQKVIAGDLEMVGLHDGVIDRFVEELLPHLFFEGRIIFTEEAAFAGDRFDDALFLEFGIGLGDGVAVDAELFGDGADGWEGFAGPEGAGGGGGFELIDELEVDRFAGSEIEVEDHKLTVL